MVSKAHTVLMEMATTIDDLEKLALILKEKGEGIPAVDKNCTVILSALYNLKFGIYDITRIDAT